MLAAKLVEIGTSHYPHSSNNSNSNKVSVAVRRTIVPSSKNAPTPHPLTNGIEGRLGTSQPGARGQSSNRQVISNPQR